ncbi:MAG: hypothetical protein DWQ19_09960 [Crenarchaeota archaeon]|nr:MAG: hypothetical protein DWQ19_09960 [Thermoproteota archaeon]
MSQEESMPFIWKVFGGAFIGLVGTLLFVLFGTINGNINTTRADLSSEITSSCDKLEKELAKLEDDKVLLKDNLAEIKNKLATLEESRDALKEKILALENSLRETSKLNESAIANIATQEKETNLQIQASISKLDEQIRDLRDKLLLLEKEK